MRASPHGGAQECDATAGYGPQGTRTAAPRCPMKNRRGWPILSPLLNTGRKASDFVRAVRQSGFTLLELLLAILVVAALTTIAVATYGREMEQAKVSQAEADITSIEAAIALFEATNKRLPTSLAEVGEGSKVDPWGHPYDYLDFTGLQGKAEMRKDRNLVPLNSDYDLFSAGPDGAWLPPITAPVSQDDIIRAGNGGFVGQASDF